MTRFGIRTGSLVALAGLLLAGAAPMATAMAQDVARENTLIVGFERGTGSAPVTMNPYMQGANLGNGLQQAVTESLFYLNYETGELEPWLAESAETSDDGKVVTIKLRSGITWSDGQPFTADDVVFTLDMLKANAPELAFSADISKWIDTVTAVDPQTVQINLTESNQRFVENYFGVRIYNSVVIVPKHIWEGQDPKTFTNFDLEKGWPVFTGPYKLTSVNASELVYDRVENWWAATSGFKPLPAPQRVVFVDQGPEERRAAQLEANQVDTVAALSMGAYEVLKARNPGVSAWTETAPYGWLDPCPHYLELNTAAAPWDDAEMRHALSYAIDANQYSNVVTEGSGIPAKFLFPAYGPLNAYLDANAALFDKYGVGQFDPAKAKAIFESKGYTLGGDGFYAKDGNRLTVRLVMLSAEAGGATWGVAINALTDALTQVGVFVDARALDFGAFNEMTQTGQFDAHVKWSCGSVSGPYETMNAFNGDYYVAVGERASQNTARYNNPEYDAIVDQMGVLPPDDPKIAELFTQSLDIWLRDLPGIPLAQQPRAVPYSNRYWTNWPTEANNYVQPTNWWATAHQMLINIQPAQQ